MTIAASPHDLGTVLVVDDDAVVRTLMGGIFARAGYAVMQAGDGHECLRAVHDGRPALVTLDITMSGMDGWDTIARLRQFSEVPVVMVSAAAADEAIGRAFAAGACDYLQKPFGNRELLARAAVAVERGPVAARLDVHVSGVSGVVLDARRRHVTVDGRPVHLTRIEFDLLMALMSAPRRAWTRRELIDNVWSDAWYGDAHIVDTHIAKVRAKLGDDPRRAKYVETVRGYGFRMPEKPHEERKLLG